MLTGHSHADSVCFFLTAGIAALHAPARAMPTSPSIVTLNPMGPHCLPA